MTYLFRAVFAVAFSLAVAPAMADGACETAAQLEKKLIDGTHTEGFALTQIKVTEAIPLAALMDTIAAVAGYPPGRDKIVSAIVYKPNDLEKYNVYVAFFGADGCKLTGIMISAKVIVQMLQGVSGEPLHLLAPGQRDL